MIHTYRVRYLGPTNHRGARYAVTNLRTDERTVVDFDYAAGNPKSAAVRAASGSTDVHWTGHDGRDDYYSVIH